MSTHSFNAAVRVTPSPETPRVIADRYRLERLLGEGGMGNVWMARNVMLDLPVALKIVRPEARGEDTCQRLLMEARVEASLAHPNVVRVFDCGITEDGDAYIVMELLEGCSLGDLLHEQGALRPEFAVQLLLPVIHGLSTAHQAGVVHRDLKPDNIFISRTSGELCPKILDFGIAKLNAHDGRAPALHETGRGMVMGSPAYMAPEQVRGLPDLDARADVWAMSVVLYEALTGKVAFDAANYNAVLCEVLERELEPLTDPDVTVLWRILQRGLAKDRALRIGSLRELGTLLANWLVGRGVTEDASGEPLSWHWQLGGPARNAVSAPPMTSNSDAIGHSPKSGARSTRGERTVLVDSRPSLRSRLRGQPGAIGLGACLLLQMLLLGSSFSGNRRSAEPRASAPQAATPNATPRPELHLVATQATSQGHSRRTVDPQPEHGRDPIQPIQAAEEQSPPTAAATSATPPVARQTTPTLVSSPKSPVSRPETATTRPEVSSAQPAASVEFDGGSMRKRAPLGLKRVYASDRTAPEESVLGLKSPW